MTPLVEIMKTDFKSVYPDMLLSQVYNKIVRENLSIFPVISNGKLVGVIDTEHIIEFLYVINNLHTNSTKVIF